MTESDLMNAVGQRVHVLVTTSRETAFGYITGTKRVSDPRLGDKVFLVPVVTLDDGRVVDGVQCWWAPVAEASGRVDATPIPLTQQEA